MSAKKRALQILIFLLVMFQTFYALFSGRDLGEIIRAAAKMSPWYLIPAVGLALFYVCAEGFMIWYLLNAMRDRKNSLWRCFQYSFIGFFYSGITPSATGGQPVQLYYMNKDGNRVSDSTVVLMTVAVVYKFVLVVLGFGILIFWHDPLRDNLKHYFPLYILGLTLNVILVILILGVMLFPKVIFRAAKFFEGIFIRLRIWKPSAKREEKLNGFIESYAQAVTWLGKHKGRLAGVIFITFSAEIQPVCPHLDGISGIRDAWGRRADSHPSSGIGLHCGGYASSAGSPGDHRADVSGSVCQSVHSGISDPVHDGEQRT